MGNLQSLTNKVALGKRPEEGKEVILVIFLRETTCANDLRRELAAEGITKIPLWSRMCKEGGKW